MRKQWLGYGTLMLGQEWLLDIYLLLLLLWLHVSHLHLLLLWLLHLGHHVRVRHERRLGLGRLIGKGILHGLRLGELLVRLLLGSGREVDQLF